MKNLNNNIFKSNSGFGLIEMLVALGIGGIVLAFIMSMLEYHSRGSQAIIQNLDIKLAHVAIQNALSNPEVCSANFGKNNFYNKDKLAVLYNEKEQLFKRFVLINDKRPGNVMFNPEEKNCFPVLGTADSCKTDTATSTFPHPGMINQAENTLLLFSMKIDKEGAALNPGDITNTLKPPGADEKWFKLKLHDGPGYLETNTPFLGTSIIVQGMNLGEEFQVISLPDASGSIIGETKLSLVFERLGKPLASKEKVAHIRLIAKRNSDGFIESCYAQAAGGGGGGGGSTLTNNLGGFWHEYKDLTGVKGIFYSGHESGLPHVGINLEKPETLLHVHKNKANDKSSIIVSAEGKNESVLEIKNEFASWTTGVNKDGEFIFKNSNNTLPTLKAHNETSTVELSNDIRIGDSSDPQLVCTPEHEGKIRYSKADKKFYFCDGLAWSTNMPDLDSVIGDINQSRKFGNSEDGVNIRTVRCPAGSAITGFRARTGTDFVLGSGQGVFTSVRGLQIYCQKLDPITHEPIGNVYTSNLEAEPSGLRKLHEETKCPSGFVAVSLRATTHTGGTARIHGLQLGCINPVSSNISQNRRIAGSARPHAFPELARFLGIPSGRSESFTCSQKSYLRELQFSTQSGALGFGSMFNIRANCW